MLTTLTDVKNFLGVALTDTTQDALLTMLMGDATAVIDNFTKRRLEQDTYTEYYSGNGSRFVILKQRPVWSVLNVWLDYNGYYGQAVNQDGSPPFADATTLQTPGTYDLVLDDTIAGPVPAAWNGALAYVEGQNVTGSDSNPYTCAVANTGNNPTTSPAFWTRITDTNALVSKSGLLARVNWNWPDLGAIYLPGNLAREGGQFLGNIKIQYVAGYPIGYVPADLQYAARILVSQMRASAPNGYPLQSQSDAVSGYSYSLMNTSAAQPPLIGSIRQILSRYKEIPGMGGDLASLPSNNTSGGWR